jgi:hypothetical protein
LVEALCCKPEVHGFDPNELIAFLNLLNPSSCSMALGATQSVKEMSTKNLPEVKGWLLHRADNVTVICELVV